MKKLSGSVKTKIDIERQKIKAKFAKKKAVIERYMKGATFVRLTDKLYFVLGVLLLIFTTFILGRFPHDIWYNYHCLIVISLVILRFFNYRSKGWHYYLFDFCYFGNTLMILFLWGFPKNDVLFKVLFVYANGPFGVAIPLFKNSMIFHRLDNLISVTIHILPQLTSWNLRWYTLPWEESLEEGKRHFLTLDHNEGSQWLSFFTKIFLIPLALYLLWAALYFLKVFILSSKRI